MEKVEISFTSGVAAAGYPRSLGAVPVTAARKSVRGTRVVALGLK